MEAAGSCDLREMCLDNDCVEPMDELVTCQEAQKQTQTVEQHDLQRPQERQHKSSTVSLEKGFRWPAWGTHVSTDIC